MIRTTALSSLLLLISGCITEFGANLQVSGQVEAAPALNGHWDYELIGEGIPYAIMNGEGLHSITPDNEDLLVSLSRLYVTYAFGWIEDEIELTNELDYERVEYLQARARWMYLRARNLAFRLIRSEHDGFDEARTAGLEEFQAWLQEETDDEEDAEMLFWAGYGWGSAINVSRDDPRMLIKLSYAIALVERSRELDETYFNAGATTFMAVVRSSFPEAMGGDTEEGQRYFERAIELTERRSHLALYNYAKTFAVETQNRELFDSLLQEVISSPDQGNDVRLANKIARRRAIRLRANADDLFL